MFKKPHDLNARCSATRCAALEAAKSDIAGRHAKEIGRLTEEQRKADARRDEETAEAASKVRTAELALARDLVSDAYEKLAPLVAEFSREPLRTVTRQIGEVLSDLLKREQHEIPVHSAGSRLRVVLECLFTDLIATEVPSVVNTMGSSSGIPAPVGEASTLALKERANPAILQDALQALEASIGRVATYERSREPYEHMVKRYALHRLVDPKILEAFDKDRETQRSEEFSRTYQRPQEPGIRHLDNRDALESMGMAHHIGDDYRASPNYKA